MELDERSNIRGPIVQSVLSMSLCSTTVIHWKHRQTKKGSL